MKTWMCLYSDEELSLESTVTATELQRMYTPVQVLSTCSDKELFVSPDDLYPLRLSDISVRLSASARS